MKNFWRILIVTIISAGFMNCAESYRRDTESFEITADSSRANVSLDLRGKGVSVDEAAGAYQRINDSNTEREKLEVEKLRLQLEKEKYDKWLEVIKLHPGLAQLYGSGPIGLDGAPTISGVQYGIVANKSPYTLRAEIHKDGKKLLDIPAMAPRTGKARKVPLIEGAGYYIDFYHLDGRLYKRADIEVDGETGGAIDNADWDIVTY